MRDNEYQLAALNILANNILRILLVFGADSRIRTTKILRLSEDLPIVIEIVDTQSNINRLIPFLDDHVKEGLITLEEVKVIK